MLSSSLSNLSLLLAGCLLAVGACANAEAPKEANESRLQQLTAELAKKPKSPGLLIKRGKLLYEMDRELEAVIDLTKAIELAPKEAEAYEERGKAYRVLNEYEKSLEDLNKAIDINGETISLLIERSKTLRRLDRYAQALKDCGNAIEEDISSAAGFKARAWVHSDSGDFEAAIRDLTRAIELNPKDPSHYDSRAYQYMRLNKLDECLEDAQRALEIEPTYYWSLYRVTYVHYIRKDWDLAMEACDNFVELYPDKALPYLRRAYALGYRNEYSRAIADTNKALEIEWDNRDAKIYRAACYLDDRRYRNSFACYLDTWLDERDGKDTIRFLGTIFNGNSFSNDDSYRFMKNSEQRLEYVSRNLKEDRAAVRMLFHQSIDNVLQRASDAELLELQLKKIKADFFFKRYDDALKATVKLEEVDRNNLDLLLLKSECQLKLGLSVDALETAKALEALVVGDDDESARYRNAAKINIMEATHILVLENGGKTEGFLAEKQREREARMARRGRYSRELANVRNNPEDINAHLQAGFKIMRDSKQQSVALGYFTKALELIESSDSVDSQKVMQRDAYVNRGITYLNRDNSGDFVRARSDFQKATELFPDDAVAHQFLGVSLCLLGEFDDGQASLDRAQSLDSTLEVSRLARLILNSKDRNKSRVDADANELQDAASFKREWLSRRGFETTPYFKVPD